MSKSNLFFVYMYSDGTVYAVPYNNGNYSLDYGHKQSNIDRFDIVDARNQNEAISVGKNVL